MNYKEVLKCLKMPNYVSNDFYSMLFARSIGGTAGYDELTGTPPLTFTANGRNLINYRIYGANDGVGERTENLFDIDRERSNVFTLDASKYIYGARADKSDTTYPADIQLLSYIENQFTVLSTGGGIGFTVEVKPNTTYTLQYLCNIGVPVTEERTTAALNRVREDGTLGEFWGVYGNNFNSTFSTYSDTKYIFIVFRTINYRATYSRIMLAEGSTAPAQYIPFGYQINAVVRTENLYSSTLEQGTTGGGLLIPASNRVRTGLIYLGTGQFTFSCFNNGDYQIAEDYHFSNGTYSSGTSWMPTKTFELTNQTPIVRIKIRKTDDSSIVPTDVSNIMLTAGSTAPTQYIPYSRTDIPIYIGDTPLAQGEYVDYGEQKVYKYIGGELTPTEPPVALPALPTIDGTTVADFDNEPKPSEMYIKYPK